MWVFIPNNVHVAPIIYKVYPCGSLLMVAAVVVVAALA